MTELEKLAIDYVKALDAERDAQMRQDNFKEDWYKTHDSMSIHNPDYVPLVKEKFRLRDLAIEAEAALIDFVHGITAVSHKESDRERAMTKGQ